MERTVLIEKIKPSVKVVNYTLNSPQIIAVAGKSTISPKDYRSLFEKMEKQDVEKWIIELIRRGHGSPLEHGVYTFEVVCSRVTSHQIIRHRIASYTQLSQRYSDKYLRGLINRIAEYLGLYTPSKPRNRDDYRSYLAILTNFLDQDVSFEDLLEVLGEAFIIPPQIVQSRDTVFLKSLVRSVYMYYLAIYNGYSYEDSRYILPQAIKTRLLITMNTRELIESFLSLRMCSHAQWEIRYVAWSLWRELTRIHPEIFQYTGPRCVFVDNRVREYVCRLTDYLNGNCKPVIRRCPELVSSDKIINCLKYASRDPWVF